MNRLAAASLCPCSLAGCGGADAPTVSPPTTPSPTRSPTPEPPAVPAGLRVLATGADFVAWSWSPVAEVGGYQIQFSLDEAFTADDEVIDRTSNETSYRRENLPGGTTAYLRVRSSNSLGADVIHSAWSAGLAGTTAPAPPEPGQTWRGLTVAPEERCSPYNADDYRYPQSVEDDIVRKLGGVISPYTCESFISTRETDIEHIVARSEAHDSGLCRADANTRRRFAQDPLNLTLASPALNQSGKGALDAAEWLPDQNRCWFAQTIVDVRLAYVLTIDPTEAEALDRILAGCRSTAILCSVAQTPSGAEAP